MSIETKPGRVVALTKCPAEYRGEDGEWVKTTISGLFELVEYHPYEPSNYVWSACWTVARHNAPCLSVMHDELACGDAGEPDEQWCENCRYYDVDDYMLVEQVDPKAHGRLLEMEREMEFAEMEQ